MHSRRLESLLLACTTSLACAAASTRPTGAPQRADARWTEALRFVPADARAIAGVDLQRFDAELHMRTAQYREAELPLFWDQCAAHRGAARVLVEWHASGTWGDVIIGERVGSAAHMRCMRDGVPTMTLRVLDPEAGAMGGVLLEDSEGEPEAFAPTPDILLLFGTEGPPKGLSHPQLLALYRSGSATAPPIAVQSLQHVDADHVAWAVETYTEHSVTVPPSLRELVSARGYAGDDPLDCVERRRMATPELARVAAERVRRLLRILDRWPVNAAEDPPRHLAMHFAAKQMRERLLDVDRVKVSTRGSDLVVRARLPARQRGKLFSLVRLALEPALDVEDAELEQMLEDGLHPHFAPRPGIEYQ